MAHHSIVNRQTADNDNDDNVMLCVLLTFGPENVEQRATTPREREREGELEKRRRRD